MSKEAVPDSQCTPNIALHIEVGVNKVDTRLWIGIVNYWLKLHIFFTTSLLLLNLWLTGYC